MRRRAYVTMGSYGGAETCELVGCFLLSQFQAQFGRNIGIYRDAGLAITEPPLEQQKLPHIRRQRTMHYPRSQQTSC